VRVLVCGGRDYGAVAFSYDPAVLANNEARAKIERGKLKDRLAQLRGQGMSLLIHGGARGADSLAGEWAEWNGVPVNIYWADWDRFGKSAGIIRNQLMLESGKPDLVVAFPGGRGTAHMVRIANDAGVPVDRVAV
jgi:hypothetical protein